MSTQTQIPDAQAPDTTAATTTPVIDLAVAAAVRNGLSAKKKSLPAWLFYDAEGSRLFERITVLPEYYLTRTERAIFGSYRDGIIEAASQPGKTLRMLELGAGTATKTGILLAAAVRRQGAVQYLPVDVSRTALDEACSLLARTVEGVEVRPQVANYVTEPLHIPTHDGPTLALYIGSSIGNFSPQEAVSILRNLRAQLRPGDSLLLGTDMVKDPRRLIAAYNDSDCITEAFNLNMLRRINRELLATFDLARFHHKAIWNAAESRMEMHLESTRAQTVRIHALNLAIPFAQGETIHTENSYKFTPQSVNALLTQAGYRTTQTWTDEQQWFQVTLAAAE